jgi:outer membrane protein OmpA-like peptidoglycan-associated protein
VLGYINSCQASTRIGELADPDYLARLPAAAVINEATLAYDAGKIKQAHRLYIDAASLSEKADYRVLNGLYLTSWKLGERGAAGVAFGLIVEAGLERKRLPLKLLFQPARTTFEPIGDLPEQYAVWIASLAREIGKSNECLWIVGHTSRTGNARDNDLLSRRRADVVRDLIEQSNSALGPRLAAAGVGSRGALVGLGTDDQRDALDRRVEFRVVDCI